MDQGEKPRGRNLEERGFLLCLLRARCFVFTLQGILPISFEDGIMMPISQMWEPRPRLVKCLLRILKPKPSGLSPPPSLLSLPTSHPTLPFSPSGCFLGQTPLPSTSPPQGLCSGCSSVWKAQL